MTITMGNAGHRLRLRERFEKGAALSVHDYELLELLLTYAQRRKDVKPVAKALMSRFGSLSGVINASAQELAREPDVGPMSATLIRLVKEIHVAVLAERMSQGDFLQSPSAVARFASARIGGLPHEAFLVIFLSTQNRVLGERIFNEGTIDQVAVYPRRIVEEALARRAAGIVLAHNHPSGSTQPSKDDIALTATIKTAAALFDVRVVDHLVVGPGAAFSFVENDLLR